MVKHGIACGLLAIALAAGVAPAETTGTTTSTAGAFDRLSPGNQQIARALFQSQTTSSGTSASPTGTTTQVTPLTLNQIAAMKQSGQGWGEIFKSMKAQGLVREKNLGQVVSKFHHQQKGITPGPPAATSRRGATAAGTSGTTGTTSSARGRGLDNGAGRQQGQGSAISSGASGGGGLGHGYGADTNPGHGSSGSGQMGGGRGKP